MNTYRFHASPGFYWSNYHNVATLTSEAVVQSLAGVVVRSIVPANYGGYAVDLQLDRDNHHDAVADIHAAMDQLGLNVAQVVITEWATSIVEGALLGTGGGAAAGSATKDPVVFLIVTALGALIGAAVGSGLNSAKAMYRADRIYPSRYGWQFTQLQVRQPGWRPQPSM